MKHSIAGIFIDGNKVLIGKRLPKGDMGGKWEFPGGKVEEGESFEEAIVREFEEEFGVIVRVGKKITTNTFSHHGIDRVLHAYFVELPPKQELVLTEHTEVKWVLFDDIPSLDFVDSDMKIFDAVRDVCEL